MATFQITINAIETETECRIERVVAPPGAKKRIPMGTYPDRYALMNAVLSVVSELAREFKSVLPTGVGITFDFDPAKDSS